MGQSLRRALGVRLTEQVKAELRRNLNKLIGKPLTSVQRLPLLVNEGQSFKQKIEQLHHTDMLRVNNVTWCNASVAQEAQTTEQIRANIVKAVNYLASVLPRGWQNIKKLGIKTSMGKYVKIDY